MRRINNLQKFVLVTAAALVLTAGLAACGTTREVGAITYITDTIDVPVLTKQDLAHNAAAVIEGTVLSAAVVLDEDGLPATDYVLRVDRVFAGEPRTEVTVRVPGGTTDTAVYTIENAEEMPAFTEAERVVLFLYDPAGTDAYYVLGQALGAFTRDDTGKLYSQSGNLSFTYATFAEELSALASN